MNDDNTVTAYVAGALREASTHVHCHRYHRDGRLRMSRLMFDLTNILAHALHLQDDPPHSPRDPPVLSHSAPGEPD